MFAKLLDVGRWLLSTRRHQPWAFCTFLAGTCLVGAVACVKSLSGAPLLVTIDLLGDTAVLYAMSRYAKDPGPTDRGHVPMTGGRRGVSVSFSVLISVAAVAVVKTLIDSIDAAVGVYRFWKQGEPLRVPVPHTATLACLFICCTFVATALFYCAYAVSRKRRYDADLDSATRATLGANCATGAINLIVQLVSVGWVFGSGYFLRGAHASARAAFAAAGPLDVSLAAMAATVVMGAVVYRRCVVEALQQWPLMTGARAPAAIESLVRSQVRAVPGISLVRACNVYSIGPQDAVAILELDIEKKASPALLEPQIKLAAQHCAPEWQELEGADAHERNMHYQVDWRHNGRPLSSALAVADQLGSLLVRPEGVVPVLHYSSAAGRTMDTGEVKQVLGLEELPENALVLDCSVVEDGWEDTHAKQMQSVTAMLADPATGSKQLAYFGLADIPLTVEIGSLFDSTRSVALYQRDPGSDCWRSLRDAQSRDRIGFAFCPADGEWPEGYSGPVAAKIEISSGVMDDEVYEAVQTDGLPVVSITASYYAKSVALTNDEMRCFVGEYRRMLDWVRARFPNYESLSLFASAPCGPTLEIGRHTGPRMYGPIHLYYFDRTSRPRSRRVLTLPRKSTISAPS